MCLKYTFGDCFDSGTSRAENGPISLSIYHKERQREVLGGQEVTARLWSLLRRFKVLFTPDLCACTPGPTGVKNQFKCARGVESVFHAVFYELREACPK